MTDRGPDARETGAQDLQDRRPAAPVFNAMPPVILALAALILLSQALDAWSLRGDGLYHGLALWMGGLRTGAVAEAFPAAPLGGTTPYLLHVFVHFGWAHALINLGALLAFGAAAARPFGRGWRGAAGFLVFYFACALGGAILHAIVHANEASTMVGASTAISGLVAAAGWASGGRAGMLRLAVPWLGMNGAIALIDPLFAIPIAWAGHVGGLLVGMAAYPMFVRLTRRA